MAAGAEEAVRGDGSGDGTSVPGEEMAGTEEAEAAAAASVGGAPAEEAAAAGNGTGTASGFLEASGSVREDEGGPEAPYGAAGLESPRGAVAAEKNAYGALSGESGVAAVTPGTGGAPAGDEGAEDPGAGDGAGADFSPGADAGEEEAGAGTGGLYLEGGGEGSPDLGSSLIKVVLSMGVVVLLVLATRAFLKRSRARAGGGGDTYLKVIGYTRLGNGTGVHEVRVGERVWFIGEGEKELRLLGDFDLSELELSRLVREEGDGGVFARELEEDLAAGSGEWCGTLPRGWLNALRWKTAR